MKSEDLLRALIEAAARQRAGQATSANATATAPQDPLQALLAAVIASRGAQPAGGNGATAPSTIDNALGGQALTGKKTLLAVVAYVILSILQSQNIVGNATGAEYKDPKAAVSVAAKTPAVTPAPTPAPAAVKPATATTAEKPATDAATAAENGKTPTGVILTTLIAAFGGLGFFAKIDRAINALTQAAAGAKST